LNLGLFAKGLDLMPDLGYPPVQFGGWDSPRARWYVNTASHNTVVVDGENQQRALDHGHPPADIDPVEAVHTLLGAVVAAHPIIWGDGEVFRAIRVSGPALVGGKQYERTVAMVDVSERDFYVADVFRVVGGVDHAKFTGSHFGNITTQGLSLSPSEDFGHDTQMRNFQTDPSPHPGWSADWKIEDPRRYLPEGSDVHLRYTDFTQGAEASTCEGWLLTGHYDDAWIPRVMVRRRAESAPLSSTFVAVIEPYEGASAIAAMRRLPVETADGQPFPDTCVAIEVKLVDGRRDLLISADAENPLSLSPSLRKDRKLVQRESDVTTDSALTWVRLSAAGDVERIAFWRAEEVSVKDVTVRINTGATFVEIRFDRGVPSLASGNPQDVSEVLIGGGNVWRP
jgi:hypothetical protein